MSTETGAMAAAFLLIAAICILYWRVANSCMAPGCRRMTTNAFCDEHLDAIIAHDDNPAEDPVIDWRTTDAREAYVRALDATYGAADLHAWSVADQIGIPHRDALDMIAAHHDQRATILWATHKEH